MAAALAVLGCGRGDAGQAGQAGQGGGRGGRNGDPRVVPVQVVLAELGTAQRSLVATGTVEPLRTVGVNAQLAGVLLEVNVEEGDAVRAGQVLARVDSRELQAQLRSAEAELGLARATAQRTELLRAQQIVTEAEHEAARAALEAAQATVDQLRTRLEYATIRAPISGVVLRKAVERGDVVGLQTRLFTIGDVSTLVVRVPVSELEVTALDVGDSVSLSLDALPDRAVRGRIRRIFPAADSVTRLVPVEVALTGASAREVRPGFLARARFGLDPRENVLMVPAGALVQDAGGAAVFVVRDGRATRQRIVRGETYEGRVEVTRGLAPGDSVVVAGSALLRDGSAVRVVEPPELPGPSDARAQPLDGRTAANTGGTR